MVIAGIVIAIGATAIGNQTQTLLPRLLLRLPSPDADAAKADEAGRTDRPDVQPGGPRSAVVDPLDSGQAGRPAPDAGDAPK